MIKNINYLLVKGIHVQKIIIKSHYIHPCRGACSNRNYSKREYDLL